MIFLFSFMRYGIQFARRSVDSAEFRVEGYADGVYWCYNKSELDKFFYFQTVPEFHENAQWKKLLLV
jgi:hypothetical protein